MPIIEKLETFKQLKGYLGSSVFSSDGRMLGGITEVSGVNFEIAGSLFHDAYLFMKDHSKESGFGKANMFRVDTEKGIVIGKCFEEGNIHFHTLLVIQPNTDMKKAISVLDKVIQSLKGEV